MSRSICYVIIIFEVQNYIEFFFICDACSNVWSFKKKYESKLLHPQTINKYNYHILFSPNHIVENFIFSYLIWVNGYMEQCASLLDVLNIFSSLKLEVRMKSNKKRILIFFYGLRLRLAKGITKFNTCYWLVISIDWLGKIIWLFKLFCY
jgi:hypothetical protein